MLHDRFRYCLWSYPCGRLCLRQLLISAYPRDMVALAQSGILAVRRAGLRRTSPSCRSYCANVIVATGSDTRGECNRPKCTLARRSQLALARRPEYQTSEYLRRFQRSHWRHCAWHPPARQLEATRPVCGQLASRPWTLHPRASGQWLHPLDRLQHQPLDLRLAKLGREPSMPHPGALS